ncbi:MULTISPECIES: thermonuclease family protein [Rhizobium]|uniref:Transmembrane protein n=1 Tax=Rhizobium johnstonii (strain DSM 114642 / LMG 32736 / 3841) TaxID=216596 RepID=Q1MHF0_RHIJ3|nr:MULTISPECIES: thermonuclease family protein [Rhizobium]NEI94592.1 thermonuclease family protein [Rhizobium leguminosarum]NEJ78793.1 thermonuclease family protein [Rhizobium leguminosarum]CAK07614.1 putative transmembrane protein [Rhizobium johnstonii 3841]
MQSYSDSKPGGATFALFETEHLKANIRRALVEAVLSPWQRTFLSDVLSKLERYGNRARLSHKQLLKLNEILGGNGTPRQDRVTTSRTTRHTRRPRFRSPSFLSRQIRWSRRRLARDAVVVALIVMVGLLYSVFETGPVQSFLGTVGKSSHVMGPVDQAFTVTDGDTVHVAGERAGTRLVGFNTPEKFSPQCEYERKLGERASSRLRELVKSPNLQLTKVPCACPAGSEGTDACNHGRSCGVLKVDGRDVGQILIGEGLAVPFICEGNRCPRTPRPWCGQQS